MRQRRQISRHSNASAAAVLHALNTPRRLLSIPRCCQAWQRGKPQVRLATPLHFSDPTPTQPCLRPQQTATELLIISRQCNYTVRHSLSGPVPVGIAAAATTGRHSMLSTQHAATSHISMPPNNDKPCMRTHLSRLCMRNQLQQRNRACCQHRAIVAAAP